MKTIRKLKGWPGSQEDTDIKNFIKQNNTGNLSGRLKRVGKLARATANEPAYPCYTPPKA